MKLEIKSVYETILYSGEAATVCELLHDAVKAGANLGSADLRGANLGSANLGSANLWGADLRGADLGSADLRGANLWGADLGSADLGSANLRGANLWGANLRGAKWGEGCKVGDQIVQWIDPLVVCDGYCKSLCAVGDVAWIMSGCRWFTLSDARQHWANRDDRATTRAMLEGIAAVAKLRGLRES